MPAVPSRTQGRYHEHVFGINVSNHQVAASAAAAQATVRSLADQPLNVVLQQLTAGLDVNMSEWGGGKGGGRVWGRGGAGGSPRELLRPLCAGLCTCVESCGTRSVPCGRWPGAAVSCY